MSEFKLSDKVLDEKTTRKRLFAHANRLGCVKELKIIFNKYDEMLRKCSNEKEYKDISALGIFEIYSLFGKGGELFVDGKLVYRS